MQTKLTLRLDDELVRRAKKHAKKRGKSVSQLVADYFAILDEPIGEEREEEMTPLVRSLAGVLEGYDVSEKDYYEYLGRKHL